MKPCPRSKWCLPTNIATDPVYAHIYSGNRLSLGGIKSHTLVLRAVKLEQSREGSRGILLIISSGQDSKSKQYFIPGGMAEISHSEDQRNAGVMDSVISHWIHSSGCYKIQMDYDGWRWRVEDLVNLSCKVFIGFNVFPRYTALSTRYKDSQWSGKRVPFYPRQKVGPEAVSTHMETNKRTQVHIWHQTVPVLGNVI